MSGVTITDPWKHRATLLPHGRGYVFTTRDRPVWPARGWSRPRCGTGYR